MLRPLHIYVRMGTDQGYPQIVRVFGEKPKPAPAPT
jgi:hypothetical protein